MSAQTTLEGEDQRLGLLNLFASPATTWSQGWVHVRWSRSLDGGWKARGKDIKKGRRRVMTARLDALGGPQLSFLLGPVAGRPGG